MQKVRVLTINLRVPFKLSKNTLKADMSVALASLLDFFPRPFPFFPFFPLPFFFEFCFSCVPSFAFCSILPSLFFPPYTVFPSSTVGSDLQYNTKI